MVLVTSVCLAQEVRIGIGFAVPPYVIQEEDAGVEVDIIREAFRAVGHDAAFVYLPNLRLPLAFAQGTVECVAVNAAYDLAGDSGRAAYSSDITVVFQNYAVTLQKSHVSIASIQDLGGKKVLAFNNASKYLGPEFAAMAKSNPGYRELADQSLQVRMLYSKRVDSVISDKRIFTYWRNKLVRLFLSDTMDISQPLVFNAIFPPAPRHVAFGDSDMRDAFNLGLAAIKKNGVFDAIEAKYIGIESSE